MRVHNCPRRSRQTKEAKGVYYRRDSLVRRNLFDEERKRTLDKATVEEGGRERSSRARKTRALWFACTTSFAYLFQPSNSRLKILRAISFFMRVTRCVHEIFADASFRFHPSSAAFHSHTLATVPCFLRSSCSVERRLYNSPRILQILIIIVKHR